MSFFERFRPSSPETLDELAKAKEKVADALKRRQQAVEELQNVPAEREAERRERQERHESARQEDETKLAALRLKKEDLQRKLRELSGEAE